MEWSKVADDLIRLNKEIADARRALERTGPGREPIKGNALARNRAVNRALAAVEGLRNTLRTWFGFYDGYDPLFTWWMQEPYKVADQSLTSYSTFLRQRFGASASGSAPTSAPAAAVAGEGQGGAEAAASVAVAVPAVVVVLPGAPGERGQPGRPRRPRRPSTGIARSSAPRSAATHCSAS